MIAVAGMRTGGEAIEGRKALAFLAETVGIEVTGPEGGAAHLAAGRVGDDARDPVRGDIDRGAIEIRRVEEYRAVMAPYRDGGEILRYMDAAREFGPLPDRLVTDQDGGLLMGYRALEGLTRLAESEPDYAWVLEDARRNRLVRVVRGPQDARRQIRQLHLHYKDSAIKGQAYNLVIADQMRDFQGQIDGVWEEMARSNPGITGRFRLSSNYVGRLLGVDNKRVDRVLASDPDLAQVLYLDVMDARGIIQRGKARAGESARRGRKAAGNAETKNRAEVGGCRGEHRTAAKVACPAAEDEPRRDSGYAEDRIPIGRSASEGRKLRIDPQVEDAATQPTTERVGRTNARDRDIAGDEDPIYALGWRLYALIRELDWDGDGAILSLDERSDSPMLSGEMNAWFHRVQGYLRGLTDHGERRRHYQRILFVAFSAELLAEGHGRQRRRFRQAHHEAHQTAATDDHPILFDRVEEWGDRASGGVVVAGP